MGNIKISGTTSQAARISVFTDCEYLGYKDVTTGAYSIVMRHPQPYVATLTDDFTGTNGNPPDADRWQLLQGSPEIQSNNLYLNIPDSAGVYHEMQSRYVLSGNFRIEMPVDLTGQNNTNGWCLQLSVLDPERQNGGRVYIMYGRRIRTVKVINGVDTQTDDEYMGTTWNNAGVGLYRTGSTWQGIRRIPSWAVLIGSDWADGYTGPVKVEVKAWHDTALPLFNPPVSSVDVVYGTPVVSGTGSSDLHLFATILATGETKAYGKVTAIDTEDALDLTEWPLI